MLGKRDFWTDLGDNLLTSVTDTANTLLSGLALQLAISLGNFFVKILLKKLSIFIVKNGNNFIKNF
jgi:hypothetical protein